MNFSHTSATNRHQDRGRSSGLPFELPTISIDFNSITEALNPRNYNIPANFEDLMSSAKCSNRVKDTQCQSCGIKFTFLKRKVSIVTTSDHLSTDLTTRAMIVLQRTCFDCNMDFCCHCLDKNVGCDKRNHCKRCIVFNSVPLDRNALNGLRARDLKWFLASKRIPSQMCNVCLDR